MLRKQAVWHIFLCFLLLSYRTLHVRPTLWKFLLKFCNDIIRKVRPSLFQSGNLFVQMHLRIFGVFVKLIKPVLFNFFSYLKIPVNSQNIHLSRRISEAKCYHYSSNCIHAYCRYANWISLSQCFHTEGERTRRAFHFRLHQPSTPFTSIMLWIYPWGSFDWQAISSLCVGMLVLLCLRACACVYVVCVFAYVYLCVSAYVCSCVCVSLCVSVQMKISIRKVFPPASFPIETGVLLLL